MIEARAPGKLFVAGEYAVVEPGGRAVVVAVDRHVTVGVEPREGHGTVRSAHYGSEPLTWHRDAAGVVVGTGDRPLDHVLSAIRTVDALAADLGREPRHHALTITSELDDADGTKYGLGSSGAVTVATVRALDAFHGLGLSAVEHYRLALLATVDVAARASGGDLAASALGGWVDYRSPDRAAVAELRHRHGVLAALREPWPLLRLDPLPAPTDLELVVGWTGRAASTTALVAAVDARREQQPGSYDRFRTASEAMVAELVAGLRTGDPDRVLGAVGTARGLLTDLAATLGTIIETPALSRLCDAAEAVGAAAKSSGAGGGDCGIVLARPATDLTPMLREWQEAGIRRLPLVVDPPVGATGAMAAK